jgi:hypothetical protein
MNGPRAIVAGVGLQGGLGGEMGDPSEIGGAAEPSGRPE